MTDVPRLLLVTDRTQLGDRPLELWSHCVDAGLTDVFLRERDLPPQRYDELLARADAGAAGAAVTGSLMRAADPAAAIASEYVAAASLTRP